MAQLGQKEPLPSSALVVVRLPFFAGNWSKVPVSFYASLSIRLLMTWCLTSPRMNGPIRRTCTTQMEATFVYNLILEVIYHNFCRILLVTQTNPGKMWENTKGYGYQDVGIIGSHLETGFHKCPTQCLAYNRYLFVSSHYDFPNVHRLAGKTIFGHKKMTDSLAK